MLAKAFKTDAPGMDFSLCRETLVYSRNVYIFIQRLSKPQYRSHDESNSLSSGSSSPTIESFGTKLPLNDDSASCPVDSSSDFEYSGGEDHNGGQYWNGGETAMMGNTLQLEINTEYHANKDIIQCHKVQHP